MLLLLCLSAGQMPPPNPDPARPTVTVVPRAEPAKWVEITAPAGKAVTLHGPSPCRWQACEPASVDLIPQAGGNDCVMVAPAGRWKVFAFPEKGDPIPLLVTVGDPPPAPPSPGPVVPPTPPPADPLLAAVRAAFQADPMQLDKKRAAAADLAAVYAVAVEVMGDAAVTTVQEHSRRTKEAADKLLGQSGLPLDSLAGCRKLVAAELAAAFPNGPPAELDALSREKAKAVYKRAAASLSDLSK